MIKAFIFDLNGTMIDDMYYHTDAWFHVFNKYGSTLSREEVKMETYGKGQEMLVRVLGEGRFTDTEMDAIVFEKEKQYQDDFRPHLKLIKGLDRFLEQANEQGLKMAIGSAAIMFNIDYVLDGLSIRKYFPVNISADNVEKSKPHPETFLKAASQLGVKPEECIVFEDSPKGVQAALAAGMKVVALTIMHPKNDFDGLSILKFIEDYDGLKSDDLLNN